MFSSIDDFRGQAPLLKLLGRYLAQDKLSGSLLLTGQRGLGKTTLATVIARALCCEKNQGRGLLGFCGECYACRSIAGGNQPEFRIVRPIGTQIKVEQFRDEHADVLGSMALHPVHLPWRILVIDEAHCLNEETGNRMLKLLEEGPRRSVFMFVTDRPPLTRRGNLDEGLLPTITSRCLQFRLLPMNRWELEDDLAEDYASEPRQAIATATVMAGGSVVDSRRLAADGAWRAAICDLTSAISRKRGVPEAAGAAADYEFAALWGKEQADTGLSSDELNRQCSESYRGKDGEPPRAMTTPRRNELRRQALITTYDRAGWWLLHEAARGLEPYPGDRRRAALPLPPPQFGARLALLKQRINGNVDPTLAQAAFEGAL